MPRARITHLIDCLTSSSMICLTESSAELCRPSAVRSGGSDRPNQSLSGAAMPAASTGLITTLLADWAMAEIFPLDLRRGCAQYYCGG